VVKKKNLALSAGNQMRQRGVAGSEDKEDLSSVKGGKRIAAEKKALSIEKGHCKKMKEDCVDTA